MFSSIYFLGFAFKLAHAQDIIVTADRILPANAAPVNNLEINYGATSEQDLSRILKAPLGQSLAVSGGSGSTTSVFLRGTESYHTQVMVDGISMNDPSTPNRAYDLGHLGGLGISQVDIAKGPQSVLYGGDALGGVINITTSVPSVGHTKQNIILGAGSFGKHQVAYDFGTNNGGTAYALSFESKGEQGYDVSNSHGDNEGRKYLMGRGKFIQYIGSSDVGFNFQIIRDRVELDNGPLQGPGLSSDDPNHTLQSQELASRVFAHSKPINGIDWDSTLSYAFLQQDRKQENTPDDFNVGPFASMKSEYRGRSHQIRWENNGTTQILGGELNYLGGLSHDIELSQDKTQNTSKWDQAQTTGAHLQMAQRWGAFEIVGGERHDKHSIFSNVNNSKAEVILHLNDEATLLKLGANSGSKYPSLFQLKDTNFGNPSLRPEKAVSYEFDFSQKFSNLGKIQTAVFSTRLSDRFNYDPMTFKSTNEGRADIQGLEISPEFKFNSDLSIHAIYSNILARSLEDGRLLPRRPRDGIAVGVNYQYADKLGVAIDWGRKGKRDDIGGTLPAQQITDVGTTYRISNDFDLSVQINNLFNLSYQDVLGYEAPARNYFAKVIWKL